MLKKRLRAQSNLEVIPKGACYKHLEHDLISSLAQILLHKLVLSLRLALAWDVHKTLFFKNLIGKYHVFTNLVFLSR